MATEVHGDEGTSPEEPDMAGAGLPEGGASQAETSKPGSAATGPEDGAVENPARSDEVLGPATNTDLEAPGEVPTSESQGADLQPAPKGREASLPLPPVQVCVRLRPLLAWEREAGLESSALQLRSGVNGTVALHPREGTDDSRKVRSFHFDTVIGPEESQANLWNLACLDGLVDRVAAGFHATVFAYGQTGTGKTHTMEGFTYEHHNGTSAPSAAAARPCVRADDTPEGQFGIVPRAIQALFSRVAELQAAAAQGSRPTAQVKVSFLQIYNEHIYDLLNPAHAPSCRESRGGELTGLRLRWDAAKRAFFVENLFSYECQSAEEVLQYYISGVRSKQVASTAMNVASSRSHTVLVLTLVRRSNLASEDPSAGSSPPPVQEVVSKLSLVDLAGSERASATAGCDRAAARFQEAVNVNQSLFVLRRVITALSKEGGQAADSKLHVPYRESKLTSLLQHAIGGSGFLLMLACLSPADKHLEENLSTLQYASQAGNIKNEPVVNLDPKDQLIQALEAKLAAAHTYILHITGLRELPAELLQAEGPPCRSQRTCRASARAPQWMCSTERGTRPPPAAPAAPAPSTSSSECQGGRNGKSAAGETPREAEHGGASQHGGSRSRNRSAGGSSAVGETLHEATPRAEHRCSSSRSCSVDAPGSVAPAPSARSTGEGQSLFAAADALLAGYRSVPQPPRSRLAGGAEPTVPQVARGYGAGGCGAGPDSLDSAWTSQSDFKKNTRAPSLPPVPSKGGLPLLTATGKHRFPESLAMYQPALPASLPSPRQPNVGRARQPQGSPQATARDSPRHRPRAAPASSPRASMEISSTALPGASSAEPSSMPAVAETACGQADRTQSSRPESALQHGLWDAVEELRQEKSHLEVQLRAARGRARELEGELSELQSSAQHGAAGEEAPVAAGREPGLEAQLRAVEVRMRDLEGELSELRSSSAHRSPAAEEAAVASAVAEAQAAAEAEKELLKQERSSLRAEHDDLRREHDALRQRLAVFHQAMELGRAEVLTGAKRQPSAPGEPPEPGTGLGKQVERLHSQLVMESVALRSEVAGLKRKKWVLRSLLATGGASEQRAIDEEVGQLRAASLQRTR